VTAVAPPTPRPTTGGGAPEASRIVDAVVVGGGPNGLAAAITLARAGHSVTVFEAAATVGGGARSAELTLPGFVHDVCSAVYPFGRTSPFFRDENLESGGLRWIEPPYAIGHPLDDGSAVLLEREVDATAAGLGPDGDAYRRMIGPIVRDWDRLMPDLLAPFHVPLSPPRALRLARFGLLALRSATSLARRFRGERARALFAGAAAHSQIGLTEPISGAAALVMLASAHDDGWPIPAGGASRLSEALAARLEGLGGTIVTGRRIGRLEDLPAHRVALFDVVPSQLLTIAGDRLPQGFRRALARFRPGPGTFKLDLALDGPIPWRAEGLDRAGTVHVGGTLEEIATAEAAVARGRTADRPFVLLVQPSRFDRSRVPADGDTVWAYCHVPNGSTADMTDPILAQVERFAPGFRERILRVTVLGPAQLEAYNANDVGGDIGGGRLDLGQLFTRPSLRLFDPYSTPDPGIFLCSASTPPGGGVHGMSGFHAARSAERRLR
jgi:phytoene dehydrogenase-like protein